MGRLRPLTLAWATLAFMFAIAAALTDIDDSLWLFVIAVTLTILAGVSEAWDEMWR